MGKKSKEKFQDGEKTRRNTSGVSLNAALAGAVTGTDLNVSEVKEESIVNQYKDYDPEKEQRKKRFNNNSQSNWNGNTVNDRNRNQSGQYNNSGTGKKNYSGQGKRQNGGNSKIPNAEMLPLEQGPYAPYNFVPFSDRILEDPAEARLNVISEGLYSGEVCYEVTAQTPILVDSGENAFYRNKDGKYALPGSTMRGLIRNNLQILSFSGFRDDIDDYNLMYRAVAGSALQNPYGNVLGQKQETIHEQKMTVLKNVKAGYLKRSGDHYTLYQNKGDSADSDEPLSGNVMDSGTTNYYVVSERYVIEKAQDRFLYILDKMNYSNFPYQKWERSLKTQYFNA